MKTIVFIFFCIFLYASTIFAASYNFEVSEEYSVKGKPITFTFTYDPKGGDVPQLLVIELNHDGDQTIDRTFSFNTMAPAGIHESYTMVLEKPGYFDATATFRMTWIDANGKEQRETKELGPIRINVANWKFTAEGSLGCIESTPVLSPDGTTVYVGSEDQNLYAVKTDDGTELWRFPTGGAVTSSPAVDLSGNIYFGSGNGIVYCLNPDGFLVWSHRTEDGIFSSPALDQDPYQNQKRLYIGSIDSHLYALNMETGERIWRFKTGSKIVSSPVIGHDKTIYIGSLDNCLYALNQDGYEIWKFTAAAEILSSPALDKDGTLFFGTASFRGEVNDNNGLYALSTIGSQKWFVKHASGFPGTPVIDSAGTVCVGSNDNKLYGINRSGGTLIMYKQFSSDLLASAALGSNDYIFTGSRDGMFYGLNLLKGDERSGRNEIWKYNLALPITTSSPVIKNGYLYVGSCGYTNGALFSFFCDEKTTNKETSPSEESPWPQVRNLSDNTGITKFKSETIFPQIISTDPEKDTSKLTINKKTISVTFSMAMEPSSIYEAPDPENDKEGYYGFTIEPFDSPPENFKITWNDDHTIFTLTLPETESFKPDTNYTATLLSKAHAAGDSKRTILYPYSFTFSQSEEETLDYNYSAGGCFILNLID